MSDNPYASPRVPGETDTCRRDTSARDPIVGCAGMLVGAFAGGIVAAVAYVLACLAVEFLVYSQSTKVGESLVVVMIPLAFLLGATLGPSVVAIWFGWRQGGRLLLIIGTGVVGGLVAVLWGTDHQRFGSDPSHWVLYGPLAFGGTAAVCFTAMLSAIYFARSPNER